jgi:hypothetical protein
MTPEEASDMIEATLNQVIQSNEGHEDGDMIVDWVMVAYVTNPDEYKTSGYPMFVSNNDMPSYRVRGLLVTALKKFDES